MRKANRGSALILSLWALLLLSAAVFAWVKLINQDIESAGQSNAGLEARAFAHSGVQVALHPLVTQTTPILHRGFGPERGYKVSIKGEAGKLNLNWLLQGAATGTDPAAQEHVMIFKRYLERRGLSFQERETLVDCMLDWIDPDNLQRVGGAEDEGDYHPPNRSRFVSVEEIEQVKGSKPLTAKPGWKDDFTVFTAGPIDLQSAPLQVLEVLPNVGDARAQRFIEVRRGPDKEDETEDDRVFKSINPEALSYLGLTGDAAKGLEPYLTLRDQVVHIVSEGQSGKVHRQVELVAQKVAAGQSRIIWWKE
ncbi:MAG: ral secretion pathway protein [Chthoniobacter sp.]|jgi:type II secretory pathway component PulK|nr:ral secretion pathway protein [Chthoniobacter sp.]